MPRSDQAAPILFYDGECGLCARSVQWAIARDRKGELRYAPLQGETYARLEAAGKPSSLETMVLRDADGLHVRSDAVVRLLRHVGGAWALLGALARVCPRPLRDGAYDYVARHRIAWFGVADRCQLPAPALRERFLA